MKQKIGGWLSLAAIIFIIYSLVGTLIENALLKSYGKCIKAVLIPESSSFAHRFTKASLIYEFTYGGKAYTGNSLEKHFFKIGDTICVIYLESFPSVTRPQIYFDSGSVKCQCN